jgi:hypothetical protein
MGAHFSQPVRISNSLRIKGAANPWENHAFKYNHAATPEAGTCITGYALSGTVPAGISVSSSGVIQGTIKSFPFQSNCQDNWGDNEPDLDGQNLTASEGIKDASKGLKVSGRYKHTTCLFKFKITAYWKEYYQPPRDSEGNLPPKIPCSVSGSTTKSVEILEVKNHDYDNEILRREYSAKYDM